LKTKNNSLNKAEYLENEKPSCWIELVTYLKRPYLICLELCALIVSTTIEKEIFLSVILVLVYTNADVG
jgi:hypothetical protein